MWGLVECPALFQAGTPLGWRAGLQRGDRVLQRAAGSQGPGLPPRVRRVLPEHDDHRAHVRMIFK